MKVKIEEFDSKKYINLYKENKTDENKSILTSRISKVQSALLTLIITHGEKPSFNDPYQKYRDEINEIRKVLGYKVGV